jgi:hypothetical protein
VAGQAAGFREGAAGFDEGHELPLVVGDAASGDPFAGCGLDDTRLERGLSHKSSGSGGCTS